MGENTKFYIIIIVLIGIVLLQFLFKPKPGPDQPSFQNTLDSIKTTLADFSAQNQEIKDAAKSISASQALAESHYAEVRAQFQDQLTKIGDQIFLAKKQYVALMTRLGELDEKFRQSGAPDSIPTLEQLLRQK